jgi:hypothetical protein
VTEEDARGLIGLGRKALDTLPAQFLALLVVNLLVVGGFVWHMDSQLQARERVLVRLIETCARAG